jgi:hypothetical protein
MSEIKKIGKKEKLTADVYWNGEIIRENNPTKLMKLIHEWRENKTLKLPKYSTNKDSENKRIIYKTHPAGNRFYRRKHKIKGEI